MRIYGSLIVGERLYMPGDEVGWYAVYPFMLFHMAGFGSILYLCAYGGGKPQYEPLFLVGILAVVVYLWFYFTIFGPDEVKWLLINAALSVLGIFSQIAWLMSAVFSKKIDELPWYVHIVPFFMFVLFTFLVRQAFTDLLRARENPVRRRIADILHVVVSVAHQCRISIFGSWRGSRLTMPPCFDGRGAHRRPSRRRS